MASDEMNDWRVRKTAGECLKYLHAENKFADVAFRFTQQDSCKLHAHKVILAMRSPVFEAMFYGPLANAENEIVLEEDDSETFRLILGYIYTDKVELNGDVVLKCLYTANKYCLDGLVSICSDFLEQSVTTENVCTLLEQAKFYDMQDLQEQCFDFIIDNANDVFASTDFLEVSRQTLINILSSNRLGTDEYAIFLAALRWSGYQCQKKNSDIVPSIISVRENLGDALYQIRFPLMPIDVFAREVAQTEMLTNEEQLSIYRYNATKESPDGKVADKFLSSERGESRIIIKLPKTDKPMNTFGLGSIGGFGSTGTSAIVMQTTADIKLYRITGELLRNVNSVTISYINRQHLGRRLNVAQNPQILGQILGHDDWKIRNMSIQFKSPIILKGHCQTTISLDVVPPVQIVPLNINSTYIIKDTSVNVQQIPHGLEEMSVSN